MKKYLIILALILIPIFACNTEGTIYEDTGNDAAVIEGKCDDCELESK